MTRPGHVKIAITSNGLTSVDTGLSSARQIMFYDVGADSAEFIDCAQFKGRAGGKKGPGGGKGCWMEDMEADEAAGEDPLTARIESLRGCGILFTKQLADPAAVRVFAMKVFPVKMEQKRDVDEVISSLQAMMKRPPLWLRKAMGVHAFNGEYQVEVEAGDEEEREPTRIPVAAVTATMAAD
ncbi:NifB/NifX family molybdenum-iron cluster-binding protein [Pseudothauera rhizosphaerae]|uniref:NifB/NifX family molybdenum-iron cluster-binding protein n=1 Tax=Pseudothauera rhizosphaerae TaxID=2565932 RepID=UPI001B3B2BE9|nr:NifB/NifX family molybdenum-iron cluster-binding protein [Pseudothauera rhizosphaerae]